MFRRAINASAPAYKAQASAAQPAATVLRRARDPLLSSRTAQHYTLESGHSFIVRPPPSVIPATHSLPPQPSASTSSSSSSGLSGPFAQISALTADQSLLPSDSIENQHRLPSIRSSSLRRASTATPTAELSPDQVAQLQALRRSDPVRWTRSALAREFGVAQHVVGMLGYGQGPEARAVERTRRRVVEQDRLADEAKQGWKRTIAREERRRRRSMW